MVFFFTHTLCVCDELPGKVTLPKELEWVLSLCGPLSGQADWWRTVSAPHRNWYSFCVFRVEADDLCPGCFCKWRVGKDRRCGENCSPSGQLLGIVCLFLVERFLVSCWNLFKVILSCDYNLCGQASGWFLTEHRKWHIRWRDVLSVYILFSLSAVLSLSRCTHINTSILRLYFSSFFSS